MAGAKKKKKNGLVSIVNALPQPPIPRPHKQKKKLLRKLCHTDAIAGRIAVLNQIQIAGTSSLAVSMVS